MAKNGVTRGSSKQLLLGLIFGVVFGFLLQKGGVAKFEILVGVLLLQDFTVIQVMLSAVIVGMAGILTMHHFGIVKLHLKKTRYGANTIGGLIFGVGFGLSAYCPGTAAAALGQGNYDALAVMAGLVAGSYLFALASGPIGRTVGKWGARGELTLPQLLHARWSIFATVFCVVLIAFLFLLEWIPTAPRASG
jgi:uncharacterized protein